MVTWLELGAVLGVGSFLGVGIALGKSGIQRLFAPLFKHGRTLDELDDEVNARIAAKGPRVTNDDSGLVLLNVADPDAVEAYVAHAALVSANVPRGMAGLMRSMYAAMDRLEAELKSEKADNARLRSVLGARPADS